MAATSTDSQRLANWHQTPATRIPGWEAGIRLIEELGLVTLYPASAEVPNLYHAYVGDPARATDAGHNTPSGEVYSWRWDIGGRDAALYCTLVKKRPTFVRWSLVPAVLRLWGETRAADELYDAGELSAAAHRIATTLDEAGRPLSTGDLRAAAGFPMGKEHRAAYLKAVDELDRRLIVVKLFLPGRSQGAEIAMGHALVSQRHGDHLAAAGRFSRDDALDAILRAYLPAAVTIVVKPFAKDLALPEQEIHDALGRLAASGEVDGTRWHG